MMNVDSRKSVERSFAVVLLSIGIGSILSALVTELTGQIISISIGIGFILCVVFGLHKRLESFFNKIGGKVLNSLLSIFMPLVLGTLFLLYSLVVLVGISLGGSLSTSLVIIATVSGLLAITNLATLVVNIYSMYRRPKESRE